MIYTPANPPFPIPLPFFNGRLATVTVTGAIKDENGRVRQIEYQSNCHTFTSSLSNIQDAVHRARLRPNYQQESVVGAMSIGDACWLLTAPAGRVNRLNNEQQAQIAILALLPQEISKCEWLAYVNNDCAVPVYMTNQFTINIVLWERPFEPLHRRDIDRMEETAV